MAIWQPAHWAFWAIKQQAVPVCVSKAIKWRREREGNIVMGDLNYFKTICRSSFPARPRRWRMRFVTMTESSIYPNSKLCSDDCYPMYQD